MSGIAGIIHFDGAPVEPGLIEKMTAAMAHRGPDGINHWVKGSVALGQCMLRTTPESLEENPPLANEDGSLVLVMDGRVDNREDLQRELLGRGALLRDHTDAEMVLRAYEVWGQDCPGRIIGELVFFIWDARQRRLFGARDAAGTRHFYYHAGQGWFAFASEIKGLLALGRIEPRLNESRLLDYLVVQFDRDDEIGTFYEGISRLPAGHAMSITKETARAWRYWNPGDLPAQRFASMDECAEAFLEQLRIAVKCRLRSIGPVGAMLSGGLDSSSIVGLISKEFKGDLPQPLKTFSLIREDRENCPDWRAIRVMLEDDWLDPVVMTSAVAAEVCREYLDDIGNLNEPFALSQGFTDSLVFRAARKDGCRVIMDGMAGDLLFYNPIASMERLVGHAMVADIPALLAAYRRHGIGGGLQLLARSSLRMVAPNRLLAAYRSYARRRRISGRQTSRVPGDLLGLMHPDVASQFLERKIGERQAADIATPRGADQAEHARNFTTGLLSFAHEVNGQIALSSGVDPRSPFSDRRMIEFAVSMPIRAKLALSWYKPMLRNSMAGVLPEEVRWRRDVGSHPGWKFYEQFISGLTQCTPDIWSEASLDARLCRWIEPKALRVERERYRDAADYASGIVLLTLAILARWLDKNASGVHGVD